MSKTNFSDKCKIVGEFWLYYREDAAKDNGWSEFFEINDLGLPLAYFISSGVANVSGDGRAENYIEETFDFLCEMIDIDPAGEYKTIADCFAASDHPVLEFDDED